jgi:hypothetical protein
MRRSLILLLSGIFLAACTPNTRAFDDGSYEAVAADVIVIRPLCFVATVVGSALFVVSAPVAAISGSTGKTADALVGRPGRATFTRPMGEFSTLGD